MNSGLETEIKLHYILMKIVQFYSIIGLAPHWGYKPNIHYITEKKLIKITKKKIFFKSDSMIRPTSDGFR